MAGVQFEIVPFVPHISMCMLAEWVNEVIWVGGTRNG
ncbi:MAG: hypothetical protein EZS28_056096, partial [Streblomastix strix]